ncbi:MAG TPA: PilN domain-containing protein [Candidatus Acidoferrum sp.]|jgi:type IV pilus assembly protein PilN
MKVRLNLATKALPTRRRFLVSAGVVGTVAGFVFLALGWHVYSVRKSDQALREKTQAIQKEMLVLEQERHELERFFDRPENKNLHDRSAFLNSLIDEQSLNWTQMFMDLEKILPAGVRVISIEPRHEKGRVEVKLTIGATSDEAELKFVEALEKSTAFSQVQLANVKSAGQTGGAAGDHTQVELTAVYSRT